MDAVAEVYCLRDGGLDRQPRLAGAARPQDGEQATVGVRQACGYLAQLSCSPDEGGGLRRQIVCRKFRWRRLLTLDYYEARPNLVDEFAGFRLRLHTQLRCQHAHAFIVLAHGRRPVAGLGVQAHERAVGRFVQRIQRQPPSRIGNGKVILATARLSVDIRQLVQC